MTATTSKPRHQIALEYVAETPRGTFKHCTTRNPGPTFLVLGLVTTTLSTGEENKHEPRRHWVKDQPAAERLARSLRNKSREGRKIEAEVYPVTGAESPRKRPSPADEGIAAAREDDRRRSLFARSFDDWQKAAQSRDEDTPETRFLGGLQLLNDTDIVYLLTLTPESLHAAIRSSVANRGLNALGRWVGFPQARLVHRAAIVEGR